MGTIFLVYIVSDNIVDANIAPIGVLPDMKILKKILRARVLLCCVLFFICYKTINQLLMCFIPQDKFCSYLLKGDIHSLRNIYPAMVPLPDNPLLYTV